MPTSPLVERALKGRAATVVAKFAGAILTSGIVIAIVGGALLGVCAVAPSEFCPGTRTEELGMGLIQLGVLLTAVTLLALLGAAIILGSLPMFVANIRTWKAIRATGGPLKAGVVAEDHLPRAHNASRTETKASPRGEETLEEQNPSLGG